MKYLFYAVDPRVCQCVFQAELKRLEGQKKEYQAAASPAQKVVEKAQALSASAVAHIAELSRDMEVLRAMQAERGKIPDLVKKTNMQQGVPLRENKIIHDASKT